MPDDDQGLRSRLVRAGVDLLARDGEAALTLREIARHAGVSHGAPRRYFPAHRDLLAAIAREGYRALAAEVAAALDADHPDPYARVLALARSYLRFAGAQPEMFALMFRHDLLRGNAEGLRQASRPLFDTLVGLVAETRPSAPPGPPHPVAVSGSPAGPDRAAAAESVAAALWANLHGVAQLSRWGSLQLVLGSDDLDPVLHAVLDAHLRPAARPPLG
ncbi:TetR/AcrR family transcriptional regulator [Plantactinospora siamensis]|uniref:TetR/AcrR family transcriptional regulator n=1 Tax=Plantactinospora siamensis TaxID=555372 RepID=A0ABV6NVY1_9ACTN